LISTNPISPGNLSLWLMVALHKTSMCKLFQSSSMQHLACTQTNGRSFCIFTNCMTCVDGCYLFLVMQLSSALYFSSLLHVQSHDLCKQSAHSIFISGYVLCGKLVLNCLSVVWMQLLIYRCFVHILRVLIHLWVEYRCMQQHSGLWHCRHVTLLQLLNVKCSYYLSWDYCYVVHVSMYWKVEFCSVLRYLRTGLIDAHAGWCSLFVQYEVYSWSLTCLNNKFGKPILVACFK
jgi:hypothetical protein